MNKYRYTVWTDDGLRLQEVVPDGKARRPEPKGPWYAPNTESPDTEEDTVVALTWPQETGWRSH